jgi:hypothetical protein
VRLKPTVARRCFIDGPSRPNIHAELVLAQAGGNIGMRLRKNVRIDAQGKARLLLEPGRTFAQEFQFCLTLDIEFEDAQDERLIDLLRRFAGAREDHTAHGFRRGSHHPGQFTARDDIEARAAIGKQLENSQRRVGFDRVADQVLAARESLLKQAQPLDNLVGRVNVKRRAVAPGQGVERNFAAMQDAP